MDVDPGYGGAQTARLHARLVFAGVEVAFSSFDGGITRAGDLLHSIEEEAVGWRFHQREPLPLTFMLGLDAPLDLHQAFRQVTQADGSLSIRDHHDREVARYEFTRGWISRIELHGDGSTAVERFTLHAADWRRVA